MRVSELTRPKPTEVVVDLGGGDSVTLVFDRNKVTPAWWAATSDQSVERDPLLLPKGLAAVLLEWDVTQDDGTPFPPTVGNIAVLSYPAQQALLTETMRAAMPGEAEGKDLSVPSSTAPSDSTQPQPTSQNGQATSPQLEPSVSPSPT